MSTIRDIPGITTTTSTTETTMSSPSPAAGVRPAGDDDDAALLVRPLDGMAGGDYGAAIAAMAIAIGARCAKDDRTAARSAARRAEAEEEAQVGEMHQKADHVLTGGVVSGLHGVAAGGMQIAGGSTGSQSTSGVLSGSANVTSSSGQIWEKGYESLAAHADARAKEHESAATRAHDVANEARTSQESAEKLVDKAIDFYREYARTRADTVMATIRRA